MDSNSHQFEIIEKERVYQGFFNLDRYSVRHTLFKGGWSKTIVRELFQRGSCVAVIPYDPRTDQIVLIQQFRVGAIENSSEDPWLTEIIAGAIEAGESAREVAFREAKEEADCEIEEIMEIGQFYTTPGGSSEKITLYCAKVDTSTLGGIHGLDYEDEDILATVVPMDDAMAKLDQGKIQSAIAIIALQWLALNRERVKNLWG